MSSTVVYIPAIRVPERLSRSTRPRIAVPMGIAGLCTIGLALTWVLAALAPATHLKDAVALYDVGLLGGFRLDELAKALLELLEPLLYALWGVLLVLVALGRGRPRVALAVALVVLLAPVSAEALKPLLAHPHAWVGGRHVGAASWPSGHATAGAVLAMCAVLVAPARLRPTVAVLGAAFAAVVGFSVVLLAWHLPSDVVGGYLLATLWIALAVAGLRIAQAHSRDRWLGRGSASASASAPAYASASAQASAPTSASASASAPVPAPIGTALATPNAPGVRARVPQGL